MALSQDSSNHSDSEDDCLNLLYELNGNRANRTKFRSDTFDETQIAFTCATALRNSQPVGRGTHSMCILSVQLQGGGDLVEPCHKKPRLDDSVSPESVAVDFCVLQGVLTQWSEVFCKMLDEQYFISLNREGTPTIKIVGFTVEVTEHFITFLYQGCIKNDPPPSLHTVLELAKMGKFFDIRMLQKTCVDLICCSWWRTDDALSTADFQLAGFELWDLYSLRCTLKVIKLIGFSLRQLFELTTPELIERRMSWLTANELTRAGFQLNDITSQVVKLVDLFSMGWRLRHIKECGYTRQELTAALMLPQEWISQESAREVMALGLSVNTLLLNGWNSKRFQVRMGRERSAPELEFQGYTHEELLQLGYSERILKAQGIPKAKKLPKAKALPNLSF